MACIVIAHSQSLTVNGPVAEMRACELCARRGMMLYDGLIGACILRVDIGYQRRCMYMQRPEAITLDEGSRCSHNETYIDPCLR